MGSADAVFILFACFTSYFFLRVRRGGRACCTLLLQLPSVCVKGGGGGGGAGANEYCKENSYFTLESNQSYIYT